MIIFLRFGSLSDESRPWLGAMEVFLRTGIKMSTQYNIIRRWRQHGYVVLKKKRKGKSETLGPEALQWLLSEDTLEMMAPMGLHQRAAIVRDRLDLPSFSGTTLRNYSLRHGVRFKRPDYKFWKSQAEKKDLREKQLVFVQELGTMIKENSYDDIVYIDETTLHLWQKASKCWVMPGMKLPMQKNRGPSLTVIGAISEARGLVHHSCFAGSNTSDTFSTSSVT